MGIVERFNRTLVERILKLMASRNKLVYLDALDGLVKGYNDSQHSFTFEKPAEVMTGKVVPRPLLKEAVFVSRMKVGDRVRFRKKKGTFDKRKNSYSITIHVVEERVGNKWRLSNGKAYDEYDLQKVDKVENDLREFQVQKRATRNENRISRNQKQESAFKGIDRSGKSDCAREA